MVPADDLSAVIEKIHAAYGAGPDLANRIQHHLQSLPRTPDGWPSPLAAHHRAACEALRDEVCRWFAVIAASAVPYTAYERQYVTTLMHTVSAATESSRFFVEYRPSPPGPAARTDADSASSPQFNVELPVRIADAQRDAARAIDEAMRIARTALSFLTTTETRVQEARIERNTAFLLMWMDPSRPELADVHDVAREVFADFGIVAKRADEIQHQDRITDLILDRIQRAEFLFADLTGERPNVYYEVGYAHALGKRPLLYRRNNTALHFDLAGHNVPEYRNMTHLRALLRERLTAIRQQATPPSTHIHRAQKELLRQVREQLHAAAARCAPDLVHDVDVATLVLSSDGFYELRIQSETVFAKLQTVIDAIVREADLGFGISLRCTALEDRLKPQRT